MDKERSDIRTDIRDTRADIADKLEELGMRLDHARDTVRHSVDPKYQAQQRPWMTFGAAVAVGFVAQRLINRRRTRLDSYDDSRAAIDRLDDLGAHMRRLSQRVDDQTYLLERRQYIDADLPPPSLPRREQDQDRNIEIGPFTGLIAAAVSGITRAVAGRAITELTHLAQERLFRREVAEPEEALTAEDAFEPQPHPGGFVDPAYAYSHPPEPMEDERRIVTPEEARHPSGEPF